MGPMKSGKPGASSIALAPRPSPEMGLRLRGTADYVLVQRLGGWKVILPVAWVVLCLALNGGGAWVQAADDHGDTFASATNLRLGSSVAGRIDPSDDRDVFKLDLSSRSGTTDVWLYSTGDLDTVAWLYDSSAKLLAFNDDGFIGSQRAGFHLRWVLPRGVYYVAVRGYLDPTTEQRQIGDYIVHAQAVGDPGSTAGTASNLGVESLAPGRIDSERDSDYFRMDFSESTNMVVRAINLFLIYPIDAEDFNIRPIAPLAVEVLDAQGAEVSVNVYETFARINGERQPAGFAIRDDFGPGAYYFRVTTPAGVSSHPVPYTIHTYDDTEYTEFIEDCEAGTRSLDNPGISDPLFSCQWHLNSQGAGHVNVEAAWAQGVTGEGVNVAVVDDGMYHTHEDLRDNVDSSRNHDYTGNGNIYRPLQHHGTHVAGLIAARDNDIGVRGVAPRATVYGYNLLAGETTVFHTVDAMARHRATTAVSNNSWGPIAGPGLDQVSSFWEQAVKAGIATGYGGKGVLYVFSGGNGHEEGDDSNLSEMKSFYGVTAVCAVNDHDIRSGYSEMGANLWICAPSNDPTDIHQGILTTENSDRYFEEFGGTSASTPVVSGVAALMREANPDLTWRDLKLILAGSARKNDPGDAGWKEGARKYGAASESERYHFNREYGFGVVDAGAAVELANRWITAPSLQDSAVNSRRLSHAIPDAPLVDAPATITRTLALESDVEFTEFIEVTASFKHSSFRDLDIELVSPSGAVSTLVESFDAFSDGFDLVVLDEEFRFGSAGHLGEDPNGTWKLRVTDRLHGIGGTLDSWSIRVYGHSGTPTIPTPARPGTCGAAVTGKSNTGLLADCNALLSARDTLRGTAALNWAADTSIARWDGIILGGSPQRVTKVSLHRKELDGRIPAAIGRLTMLEELWLYRNELSGTIPAEMGNLSNLTWLFVSDNNLGGEIPENLNNLTLDRLWLHRNSFSGCVPYNLTLSREYKVDSGLPACAPPGTTPTPTPTPAPGNIDARLTAIEARLTVLERRLTVLEAVVARLTGGLLPTATPTATPTPTPTATPLPASRVVFGPVSGSIAHDPDDGTIDTYHARGVTTADAIIEARFHNPYSRAEGNWSSGFLFRNPRSNWLHAVVVTDDGVWYHILGSGSDRERLGAGYSEHIDTGVDGSNFIRVVADGEDGTLSVNGHHVADLDLSGFTEPGAVSAVGAYFTGHGIEGKSTRFEDFTIRTLTR